MDERIGAIKRAIEDLRDTLNDSVKDTYVVTREIRSELRTQTSLLDRLLARSSKSNTLLEVKNLRLQAANVTLSAKSIALSTRERKGRDDDPPPTRPTGNFPEPKEFAAALAEEIKKIKIEGGSGGLLGGLGTILQGAIVGIGFQFGGEIARGIERSLKKQFDFKFRDAGELAGTAITDPRQAVKDAAKARRESVLKRQGVKMVNDILSQKDIDKDEEFVRYNEEIKSTIPFKFKDNIKLMNAAYKQAEKEHKARLGDIDKKYADYETKITGSDKPIVFAVGGFAGAGGRSGIDVKKKLQETLGKKTANIEVVENSETDPSFQKILDSIPQFIKDNPQVAADIEELKKNNFDFQKANISQISRDALTGLFQGNIAVNQIKNWGRGYNPDAVKLAAKVADARRKNPNAPIDLVGYSGGGYTVEEALAILQEMGITDVKGQGVGTPDLGTGYKKNPNYKRVMGSTDVFARNPFAQLMGEKQATTRNIQGFSDTTLHGFKQYMANPGVIKGLSKELGAKAIESAITPHIEYLQGEVIKLSEIASKLKGDSKKDAEQKIIKLVESELKEINDYLDNFRDEFADDVDAVSAGLASFLKDLEDSFSEIPQQIEDQEPLAQKQLEPKKLIDRYLLYIDKLIADAQKEAEQRISVLIPNYQNLSVPQKRQLAQQFTGDISRDVKKFREAINNEDKELATEIGERLLQQIQPIKKIYEDLLESLGNDYTLAPSLRGQLGSLTAIQNEIVQGQPKAKGRAKKGLTQLVEGTADDTADGYIQSLESRLGEVENAGEELGEAALEGARRRLGIASPSKEFEEIGENSAEGYAKGLDESQSETKSAFDRFFDFLEDIPILGWFVKAGKSIAKFVGDLFGMTKPPSAKKEAEQAEAIPEVPGLEKRESKKSQPREDDYTWAEAAEVFGGFEGKKGQWLRNPEAIKVDVITAPDDKQRKAAYTEIIKFLNELDEYVNSLDASDKKLIRIFKDRQKKLEDAVDSLETTMEQAAKDSEKIKTAEGLFDFMTETRDFLAGDLEKLGAKGGWNAQGRKKEDARVKTLQERYSVYIDRLLQNVRKDAEASINKLTANYKNLTRNEKLTTGSALYTSLKNEMSRFRKAIEEGNSELATSLGEKLLEDSEAVKLIYDDLLEGIPSDSAEAKKLKGERGYLSSMQGEIVRGSKGKGKAKTGIYQAVGENVSESFAKGIDDKLNEAEISGDKLAYRTIWAAKERLKIQSPSRVFLELGLEVVQGFVMGMETLQDAGGQPVRDFIQGADRGIASFVDSTAGQVKSLFDGIVDRFPILGKLKDLLIGALAGVGIVKALEAFVGWFTQLANASFDAVVQLESLQLAMLSVSGSAKESAKGLAFVREEARKLGLELQTAEQAYMGLKASTRFSALEGQPADQIFSAFAETAAKRGLSNEEQSRMFSAINQMISKKKLSAEEVRGQLGEISGLAFESTLARSLGLNAATLNQQMGDGLLFAEDVLPKVAAQYAADNAAISGSSETMSQAMNRVSNALLELKRSFQEWIAGSKPFFNAFASGVTLLTAAIPGLIKAVGSLTLTLALDNSFSLVKALFTSSTALTTFKNLLAGLASAIQAVLPALLAFLKTFLLVTLAIDAVGAAVNVAQNAFGQLQKDIEDTTARANALEKALQNVGKAANNTKPQLPKEEREVKTSRTWNILGLQTPFNLEPVRQALGLRTLGAKELDDFRAGIGDLLGQVDRTLFNETETKKVLEDIQKIDDQLNTVRSRRFTIASGDKKAYEESIAQEQKLLKQRDELLKVTAQFQTNLESDETKIRAYLQTLDELVAKNAITEDSEASIRQALNNRLADIEKTQETFENLSSALQKSINALSRLLRNLNEQSAQFNESLNRSVANSKAEITRRARITGIGSQTLDTLTQEVDIDALEQRLGFMRSQLATVANALDKPDFKKSLEELRSQAEKQGVSLENTATIDRMLEEGRSQQETAVLNALKRQLELETEIATTAEQYEQSLSAFQNGIRDLARAIEEYFFNLNQQIKEALLEIGKITEQLKYGNIKNRLQRAIVPGSDTFINGLIGEIQGIFDAAAQITERIFGQRGARLGFESERFSLQNQLADFTKNLGGATEALEAFKNSLNNIPTGGVNQNNTSSSGVAGNSKELGQRIVAAALQNEGWGKGIGLQCANAIREVLKDAGIDLGVSKTPFDMQLMGKNTNPARANSFGPDQGQVINKIADLKPGDIVVFRDTYAGINNKPNDNEITHVGIYLGDGIVMDHSKKKGFHRRPLSSFGNKFYRGVRLGGQNSPSSTVTNKGQYGRYTAWIIEAAQKYRLDPNFFAAMLKQESQLNQINPQTGRILTSPAGALGIGQLMPATARGLGVNPYDPRENILGAAKYLRQHLNTFKGNTDLALAAYNAGAGNVRIHGGVPPFRETQNHIKMVNEYYRQFQRANPLVQASPPPPVATPVNNVNGKVATDNTNRAAAGLTDRLIKLKERQLDLSDATVRQELEAFLTQIKQSRESIMRSTSDALRNTKTSLIDSENQLRDLRQQYSPQTLSSQREAELRGVGDQFRNFDNQLFEQERSLTDTLTGLNNVTMQLRSVMEILKSSNSVVDQESAKYLESLITRFEGDKSAYSSALAQIKNLRAQIAGAKKDAVNFVLNQDEMRRLESELDRIGKELEVASQSNDLESERKVSLLQSQLQLETEILKIRQDFADNPAEADRRINLARESAKLREKEIQYSYETKKLGQETAAIEQQIEVANRSFNLEQRYKLELLQSEKQLQSEILEIQKEFAVDPTEAEKRIRIAREIADLRKKEITYSYESEKITRELSLIERQMEITIANGTYEEEKRLRLLQSRKKLEAEILDIKNQYLDADEQQQRIELARERQRLEEREIEFDSQGGELQRRREFFDMDAQITEGEANRIEATTRDTFEANRLREESAMAAERLRLEEQLLQINRQYARDPERRDDLASKAKKLSEIKIEEIDRQFKDLGETIAGVATDAFGTFFTDILTGTKSVGDAFLDMANSILKSIGQIAAQMAVTSLFKWMGLSFSEGGTVPNYAFGGTIKDALRREGPRGVLGVFTPGEEILSLRTGEAQRYQSLKKTFGDNPLREIVTPEFNLERSLLMGTASRSVSLSESSIAQIGNTSTSNVTNNNRSSNVYLEVKTPDANSFIRSERQIGRLAAEYIRRS